MVTDKSCIVIGASHAGVNFAFALRREGWSGVIILIDADPTLPYHRPPLSKAYLTGEDDIQKYILKSEDSYSSAGIALRLGEYVKSIDRSGRSITLSDGNTLNYDKLVLATGARPLIPSIPGIKHATNVFSIRTAEDALNIRKTFRKLRNKRIVIIGGGYIGLETAAYLRKLGGDLTILEREERVLARVTSPQLSSFFTQHHKDHGVKICTSKNVTSIETINELNEIICSDGDRYLADMVIIGVGIVVNQELAASAGLDIENGISVDTTTCTSDPDIYAIGDCTYHYNPHYKCHVRLESVQNAVDQAKVAAANVCGKTIHHNSIPWFWSDQYDTKLQMVGLQAGYNNLIIRKEASRNSFSIWYFKDDELLAVDAVNNAKAYVLGTKFIKSRQKLDKAKLADASVLFKPANLLSSS